eukprot:GFUD01024166.1.p1 GENE.GFUD01024166.1~~GFUD01024166.1.p1  ORF type:complete len:597 (+),score=169.12 GFUD01024166.1:50-1840(+)
MKARNKKSLNAGYKNRKNKAGDSTTTVAGVLEKDVVMAVRKEITRGREDLIKNAYGNSGLEEYLVGTQFEKLEEETFFELGRKYYQKSCDKGHPLGQFAVALMHMQGSLGQSKDEELGVEMMNRAAKARCGPALYNKGRWHLEGIFGQEQDAKKANKLFHRALKDPVMKEFKQQHVGSLVSLAQLRMSGSGCSKSVSAALRHYKAAEEVDPDMVDQKVIKQLLFLESISGVEMQREADSRNRRLKVLARNIQYQSLGDWILLYKHCGFDLSVQPSKEEIQVSLDHDGMVKWMEIAEAHQTLPEHYPAMSDPLPPLECERPGCDVTEDTSGEKMKKCTECQAPYCGVACQRKDWTRHKPVCEAIEGSIGSELTSHEMEILKQDEGLAEKLKKMGISMEEFEEVSSNLKECHHSNSSIPCGFECFQEKGAGSQNKHKYTLVGQSVLTESQRQLARNVGLELPQDLGHARPRSNRDEKNNAAAEAANGEATGKNESKALRKQLDMLADNPELTYCLFTPENEDANRGITLTNFMGVLMFGMLWERLLAVPWGASAGTKCLYQVYDLLQGSVGGTKYKNMLRNQMMAEFGADPLEWKRNN